MKFVSLILACVALLAVCGCASANHQSHIPRAVGTSVSEQQLGSRLEIISYDWEDFGIEVSFTKRDRDSCWGMTVRDSWDIYDQFKEEGKVLGLTISKCSKDECLRLIDRSLTQFHVEKPDARFQYVAIEMHVVRDLWGEILTGLSQKLSPLNGKMKSPVFDSIKGREAGREPLDIPDEVTDEIGQVLNRSQTTAAIKTLLRKHGINVQSVNIGVPLVFKDSLAGRKWSDIATLPDVGVLVPGVIEFDPDNQGCSD